MELPPPYHSRDASSTAEILGDVSAFLLAAHKSTTSLASFVGISNSAPHGLGFCVECKRTCDTGDAEEGCANSSTSQKITHIFCAEERDSVPQLICKAFVACSTWDRGQFDIHEPGLHDLVVEVFFRLRSSRSLSTLSLDLLPCYHRHLPMLLCENPLLERLILRSPGVSHHVEDDAESIAVGFSRNSVLKSCTLSLSRILDFQSWERWLRPFSTSSEALKELVIKIYPNQTHPSLGLGNFAPCGEAIVNLVRCNATLEKLEIRSFSLTDFSGRESQLANALAVNETLQEFGCVCSIARLKEIVLPGMPK